MHAWGVSRWLTSAASPFIPSCHAQQAEGEASMVPGGMQPINAPPGGGPGASRQGRLGGGCCTEIPERHMQLVCRCWDADLRAAP
jgi:hypothetical protein